MNIKKVSVPIFLFAIFSLSFAQETQAEKNNANLRLYPFKDELTKASDYAKNGNWRKTVDILSNAVKLYPNHIVQSDDDKNLYLGIEEYVLRTIANFPEEGKKVYREQIDPIVKKCLNEGLIAKDIWELQTLLSKYPYSTLAPEVAESLGELYLENGDFEKASDKFANIKTPESYAELAICYSKLGDIGRYSKLVRDAQKEFPNAQILIADKSMRLIDFINSLSVNSKPPASEQKAPNIDTANPTIYPVGQARYTDIEARSYGYMLIDNQPSYDVAVFKPIFPIAQGGVAFWHNEYATTAVDATSPAPKILWEQKIQQQSQIVFDDRTTHTISYGNGRVFANMVVKSDTPEIDPVYRAIVKVPFPKKALFAIDAKTGKLIWKVKALDELGDVSFCQSPAVEGGNLFACITIQKVPTDPFQHYVVCLEADTGKLKWATFIASGLTEINLFNNPTRDSIGSPITIAGDSIFYSTNVGVVAALDKSTGRIKWIYKYKQIPTRTTRNIYFTRNPLEWINNAPLATDKLVFFTPTDAQELYALDCNTGKFKWLIHRQQFFDQRYIYGVIGNNLYLGGNNLYIYDIAGEGRLIKRFSAIKEMGSGKGAILDNIIYFPTNTGFYRLKADTLEEIDFTPWTIGGGNIAVFNDGLVAAGKDNVIVYRRKVEYPKVLSPQPDVPRK